MESRVGQIIGATNGATHKFDYTTWRRWYIGEDYTRITKMVPILRHVENMTKVDAIELEKYIYGDDGGTYIGYNSLRVAKLLLRVGEYEPRLFLWLISKGFDLFGLIKSGQAIRREVGNV